MKGNYILTLVLTLLVGISIGIFGLSTYQNLTNTNNNNQEEKENNNQSNQLTNISYKEVKQLVDQVTDWLPGNVFDAFVFGENASKKSLSVEEIDADYLAYMLFSSSKLEVKEICGTEHETNLKKLNIIGEIGAGQYDCTRDIFYTIDSIKEASKEIFGKELTQFTTATTQKDSAYYYYKSGNIGIIRYAGVSGIDYTMTDYYVKDSVLSIEVSGYNKSYKLNYKVVDNNYYLESVHKI